MPEEKRVSVLLLLAIAVYLGTCKVHEREHMRQTEHRNRSICELGLYDNTTVVISLNDCQFSDADLPSNIFHGLIALKYLNLGGNFFTHFSPGLFQGLSSLLALDLSRNKFLRFQSEVFNHLYNLEELHLDQNHLFSVDNELFRNLSKLEMLTLSSNFIQQLPPGIFQDLHSLRILDLSSNDIKNLPSTLFRNLTGILRIDLSNNHLMYLPKTLFQNLTTIQNLTIKSCSVHSLSTEHFQGLFSLLFLSLQNNHIETLPAFLFKDLFMLKELRLLQNHIKHIHQKAFMNLSSLELLRLSKNKIKTLKAETFAGLTAMRNLSLRENHIDYLPDNVFLGLSCLEELHMDFNRLSDLPAELCNDLPSLTKLILEENRLETVYIKQLKGCHNLSELRLTGNRINKLADNVSLDLTHLEVLSLADNQLTSIPTGVFDGLISLKELDLELNQLEVLQDGIFKNISSLQKLSLKNNNIETLPSNIFNNLHLLLELNLNYNHLNLDTETMEEIFNGLYFLETLYLANNSLSTVTPKMFKHLVLLTDIDLGGNDLTRLPPDLFGNSHMLSSIQISFNRLSSLASDLLSKAKELYYFNFSDNNITKLPNRFFRGLSISKLFLFENKISEVSWDLFQESKVEELRLDSNNLRELPDQLFQGLQLQMLNLFDNHIKHLSVNIFSGLSSLKHISLQKNDLVAIETIFKDLVQLQYVDLRDNKLSNLPSLLFKGLHALNVIRLSNNSITNLPPLIFEDLYNLEHLDLGKNKIAFIDAELFQTFPKVQQIYLNQNQLITINLCAFHDKLKVLDISENNINSLSCTPVGTGEPAAISNLNLASNRLTDFKFVLFMITLDYNAYLDLSNNELSLAGWIYDPGWLDWIIGIVDKLPHKLIISYRNNKVTSLNQTVEHIYSIGSILNLLQLDMTGNNIICDCYAYEMQKLLKDFRKSTNNSLDDSYLKSWKCSDPIQLRGRILIQVSPQDLRCQANVKHCPQMCRCFITKIDTSIRVDCQDKGLTEPPTKVPWNTITLNLTGNMIESLGDLSNQRYMLNLSQLLLSQNKLKKIPDDLIPRLIHLDELTIRNNLITAIPFGFTQMNHTILSLGGNVLKCDCHAKWLLSWMLSYRHNIIDIDDVLCDSGEQLIKKPQDAFVCVLSMAEIALVVVSTVVTVSVVLISLGYTYRIEIKVFLYTRFNWHPFDNPEEQDMNEKLYDAFVSYSGHDVQWVLNTLQQQLETPERSYRLCMNDRDFLPGEEITTNIINGVKYSRKMLMILTRNFIQSEWCRFEFITAHRRVLKGKTNYLIVILFDHINVNELDEDLQIYLKTNTYLYYADKWFWDKLMYAMPQKSLCTLRGHHFPEGGFNTLCPTPVSLAAIQNLRAREEEQRLIREEEEIEDQ